MICNKCGEKNPDSLSYCKYCGEKLGAESSDYNSYQPPRTGIELNGWQTIVKVIIVIASYSLFMTVLVPIDIIFGICYGIKNRNKNLVCRSNDTSFRVGWFLGTILWPGLVGVFLFPYWVADFFVGMMFG